MDRGFSMPAGNRTRKGRARGNWDSGQPEEFPRDSNLLAVAANKERLL
jgi:hypothetical protein